MLLDESRESFELQALLLILVVAMVVMFLSRTQESCAAFDDAVAGVLGKGISGVGGGCSFSLSFEVVLKPMQGKSAIRAVGCMSLTDLSRCISLTPPHLESSVLYRETAPAGEQSRNQQPP